MATGLHRPGLPRPGLRRLGRRRNDVSRWCGDRGQSTVEFALVLPVLLVVVLGLVQVGVAIRNELAVELAAREGARAAVVSANGPASAVGAATAAVSLPIGVSTSSTASTVTVTVTYVDPTDVAIIGRFLGPTRHEASVTMAIEPP